MPRLADVGMAPVRKKTFVANWYESRISIAPTLRRTDTSTFEPKPAMSVDPATAKGRTAVIPWSVLVPRTVTHPTSAEAHGRADRPDHRQRSGQASRLPAS